MSGRRSDAMLFIRQTWTLVQKDLLIIVRRHWFSTLVRTLILPLAYILLISYVRNFFLPPAVYGIGAPSPILNPSEAFSSQSDRDRVVFVSNNVTTSQITTVINSLVSLYSKAGADVHRAATEAELPSYCRSSLTGTTRCYGAVSFLDSPSSNGDGYWNYTIFSDWSLGSRVDVESDKNDAQVYSIPFVQAIDSAIANASGVQPPQQMLQFPYTSQTIQQRDDQVQERFMDTMARYLGVVVLVAVCGVTFHLPGHVAREREIGISSLIDTMNPQKHQFFSHASRIISTNLSFNLIYIIGFLCVGTISAARIFIRTSAGMQILFHLLMCFSLTASSNFAASFFRTAQLSGITVVIVTCLLGIVAQLAIPAIAIAEVILVVLFPPITYVRYTMYLASTEENLVGANLMQTTEGVTSLPGYWYIIAASVQTILFLCLSLLSEHWRYGTASASRKSGGVLSDTAYALRLTNFSKTYRPGFWARLVPWKHTEDVHAVSDLSFTALKGQLVALLGENGSGKTTTISAITAQERVTSGAIELDGIGGLGFCPQKNVLWDELTVLEHVRIFNRIKSANNVDSAKMLQVALQACDLGEKMNAKIGTLSGGQKRKVQLAMALTGGSKVCCVDEASSGLDPASRRKIWDILLSVRGQRTLLFTTHALDEADALADHVIIMRKGRLQREGSAIELKQKYGGGYQVHVCQLLARDFVTGDDVHHELRGSNHVFHTGTASLTADLVSRLENCGIYDYEIQGPTIEQVFLNEAEQPFEDAPPAPKKPHVAIRSASDIEMLLMTTRDEGEPTEPVTGPLPQTQAIGPLTQLWVLFRKRLVVLPRNWVPYLFALIIPIITAILATNFLHGFAGISCSPDALNLNPTSVSFTSLFGSQLPMGPTSELDLTRLQTAFLPFTEYEEAVGLPVTAAALIDARQIYSDWSADINTNFSHISPGGYWVAESGSAAATLAYQIDGGIYSGAAMKAVADAYSMNKTIAVSFSTFALPLAHSTGDSLQLIIYFGLAMAIAPGLFALYPSFERHQNIKALQYSNGVRAAYYWLAHSLFDSIFVVIISSVTMVVFATNNGKVWYEVGYLWPTFYFYGISSLLLAYTTSLFVSTQLGAFAFAAGYQAITFLLYLFMYFLLLGFSAAGSLVSNLMILQFTFGLITPAGNLLRSLLLGLNQSQIVCQDQTYRSPSSFAVYTGPILVLVLQCLGLYGFLVCYDNGQFAQFLTVIRKWSKRNTSDQIRHTFEQYEPPLDVLTETERAEASHGDALRVLHLSKAFSRGKPVVSDLTFGIRPAESFALLGPNGAGKTTTLGLIRDQLKPTGTRSEILVDGYSLRTNRSQAMLAQGVCPQFDAVDLLTVSQHMEFYARAAGIPSRAIKPTAAYILRALGISQYSRRMATTLSGGNKRKLSLAIAVVGNPKVLLLDEPSTGMDAVSKRVIWRALEALKTLDNDRRMAMVITSHSMEEVAALADRVAIMKKSMLAVGEQGDLIRRFGDRFHIHAMLRPGLVGDEQAAEMAEQWIAENVPGAVSERKMLHGQVRFWVPRVVQGNDGRSGAGSRRRGIAEVIRLLEQNKARLGIEYYSIVHTNLEDVFLNVVGYEDSQ